MSSVEGNPFRTTLPSVQALLHVTVHRPQLPQCSLTGPYSAELAGPRKPLTIRLEIFDFEPDLGLKLDQTKPKISGTVPANWHTTILRDSGPTSAHFDDPTILNCEIAQPSLLSRFFARSDEQPISERLTYRAQHAMMHRWARPTKKV